MAAEGFWGRQMIFLEFASNQSYAVLTCKSDEKHKTNWIKWNLPGTVDIACQICGYDRSCLLTQSTVPVMWTSYTDIRKHYLLSSSFKGTWSLFWQSWDLILMWNLGVNVVVAVYVIYYDLHRTWELSGLIFSLHDLICIFFYHVTIVKISGKTVLLNFSKKKCYIYLHLILSIMNHE